MTSSDHYMLISSDTHAGASHAAYREYLDKAYLEDFDAWRNKYRNPYKDLAPGDDRRLRNWDNEMRNSAQDADGVVGEVVFPNTVPPFFPSFVLFAPPPTPDVYEHRLAGIRAHNRWLADWCAEFPDRRAGIGQIFLNDIDDAVDEAKWIAEHGLRGGILLPPVPPDVHDYIRPLSDPAYDRLWALCQDMEIPINLHGGTGSPTYPKLPSSTILHIQELQFYSHRPLTWLILSGVFERFPGLRLVMSEQGCAWLPPFLEQLDGLIKNVKGGSQGELRFTPDMAPPRLASEYVKQNLWLGVSFPSVADVAARDVVTEGRWMWGSDFPHDEGTYPFTREAIRQVFTGVSVEEKRRLLGLNAADLYRFDVDALAPEAERLGPLVAEMEQPLLELPEDANMALLRGIDQGTLAGAV